MENEKKRKILDKIADLLPAMSETALDQLLSFIEWLGFWDNVKRRYE